MKNISLDVKILKNISLDVKIQKEEGQDIAVSTSESFLKGFSSGLEVEKIIGATFDCMLTKDPGVMYFLIKWKGLNKTELVPAKDVKKKIPSMVIKFYQEKSRWC